MAVSMSLSQALDEVVLVEKRLKKAISEGTFVATTRGIDSNATPTSPVFKTVADLSTRLVSDTDSVIGLIARRRELRKAIAVANSTSKVTIAGEEFTIAQAIDLRNEVKFLAEALHKYKAQYTACEVEASKMAREMDAEIERLVNSARSAGTTTASDSDLYTSLSDQIKAKKAPGVIQARDVHSNEHAFVALEKRLQRLETDLKYTLTQINATTLIEV